MNYELLKSAIEKEAKAQGLTDYEIYYMSSDELSVDTLNKEPSSFASALAMVLLPAPAGPSMAME